MTSSCTRVRHAGIQRCGYPCASPYIDRTDVAADSDFGVILAAQDATHPSFNLFRDTDLLVAIDYTGMLIPALEILEPAPFAA